VYNIPFPLGVKMIFPLSVIGFAAVIVQIILLRELVTVFNGNELTYGISLMIWLTATSLGSFLAGKTAKYFKDPLKALIYIELAISMIVPAEIYFARISKILFNIPAGSLPDLNSIFIISVLSMAPACILFGSLFTLGSKTLTDIGNMYIVESAGSVLGGVVFSFILIYLFDPFQIAGISGALLSISAIYIYKNYIKPNTHPETSRLVIFSIVLALNLIVIYPYGARLDVKTSRAQFGGLNLVRSVDSIYGRISVIEDKGAYSYFEGGVLVFSTASVPENEEIAHLAFLESRNPQKVLLIGGGPALIPEILKHRIRKLDYVEFDPKLARLSGSAFPVTVTDGRYFIRHTSERYDLIIINLGDPANAATGRFYTLEFMEQCRNKLAPGGVLAMKLSGSADFMSKETRTLNTSIFKTLNLVFPEVMVIPGSYNYYFAADKKDVLTDDANILVKRWKEKKIRTIYFNELSIPHIVSSDRLNYVKKAVRYDDKTMVNSDLHPISYLYSMQIWLSYFPGLANIPIQAILAVKLRDLILWLFALAAIFKAATYRIKAVKDASIPAVVTLIGSTAMILQLLTIYSFEAIYGYIYYMIGILIAVFMGGLAAGSYLANNRLRQIRMDQIIALLLFLTAAFALYLHSTPELDLGLSKYLIPIFSFMFAVLVGAVFPAAVRDYRAKDLGNKAGVLYGCDLLGGAFSAVLTSLLFMPVFGIIGTILIPICLCLISLLLIY
jgi:spermidine synthase